MGNPAAFACSPEVEFRKVKVVPNGSLAVGLRPGLPCNDAPKIGRPEVRELFKPFTSSCDSLAACKVAVDILSYSLLLLAIIYIENWPIKAALSIPAGMVITRLFILGHDACHGSLFSRNWVNRWIGRLCSLASLTPYSLWELGHNTIHHGFTNLKGRDSIWTPLSLEAYRKANRITRWLQRSYRTPWGVGLYYTIELWWKKLFFPSKRHVGVPRREHLLDNLLVSGYLGLLIGVVSLTAASVTTALVNFCLLSCSRQCSGTGLLGSPSLFTILTRVSDGSKVERIGPFSKAKSKVQFTCGFHIGGRRRCTTSTSTPPTIWM